MIDYYEILEVSPNASLDVIKAAYHVLLARYDIDDYAHPKEIEHKVTAIKLAFDVLSDPEKRKEYDHHLNTLHRSFVQKHSAGNKTASNERIAKDSSLLSRLKWNKWGWSVSIVAVTAVLISMVQPDPERAERGQLAAVQKAQKERAKLEADVIKQAGGKLMQEKVNQSVDSDAAINPSSVQTPSVNTAP